jgi:small subunit ribosomal protein S1
MDKDKNLDPAEETNPQMESQEPTPQEPKNLQESSENDAAEESESYEAEPIELLEDSENESETAHDDFAWDTAKRKGQKYTSEEYSKYLSDYDSSYREVEEGEVLQGVVTSIRNGDVVLDINYKSDGLVNLSEFRDTPDLSVGDSIDVYVEQREDERGRLVLSRRKAKLLKAWENIVRSYEEGTIIKGTVVSKTKGGLIVDASGLETFLPGSQIDIKPILDYDVYVGKTMEFKVVKINEAIKNAVVSHKALIESDLAEQRDHIISGLEKGQVLEGVVKNITDFGAFMDLGGVDGLLYITDISWGRINHPSEVLELNQKVNVVVLDFDENKKRISLGLKQLTPHPWDVLAATIQQGSVVKGQVVNIEDYGAFLEITPGVEGLIHVSEVSWSNQPVNAREFFTLGQEFEAKVVTVDRDERKMSLSVKQLSADPWEEIEAKFPANSRHKGEVKNLTPYGVFVELEEGIGGMVHISDLSWTKRYSHPSEFTAVGKEIDVVILEIDKGERKISLGHKQLEENPWDTFENVFPVGSYHEATILRKDDRGATVQLPYGLEAYAPIKHIKKEDGTQGEVDEIMTFKVLEFNRDDKRILVSHLRYLEDIAKEADDVVQKEREDEKKETRRQIDKQKSNIEKSTLGDLAAFDELKEQFEGDKKDEE